MWRVGVGVVSLRITLGLYRIDHELLLLGDLFRGMEDVHFVVKALVGALALLEEVLFFLFFVVVVEEEVLFLFEAFFLGIFVCFFVAVGGGGDEPGFPLNHFLVGFCLFELWLVLKIVERLCVYLNLGTFADKHVALLGFWRVYLWQHILIWILVTSPSFLHFLSLFG